MKSYYMDNKIPLKDPNEFFCKGMCCELEDNLCQMKGDNMHQQDILNKYMLLTSLMPVDTNNKKLLNQNKYNDLQNMLAKYNKLFDGSLGV